MATLTGILKNSRGTRLTFRQVKIVPQSTPWVRAGGDVITSDVQPVTTDAQAAFSVELCAGAYEFWSGREKLFRVNVPDDANTYTVEELTGASAISPVQTFTVNQDEPNPANTGTLAKLLSWLAGRIKAITGLGDWKSDPPTTLQAAATFMAKPECLAIAASDETTALTVQAGAASFRMPFGFTLTAVRASLGSASTSGTVQIDVQLNGVSIFTTPLTIDANEKSSTSATVPAVLATTVLPDDTEVRINIDAPGTGAKGLKLYFLGHRS